MCSSLRVVGMAKNSTCTGDRPPDRGGHELSSADPHRLETRAARRDLSSSAKPVLDKEANLATFSTRARGLHHALHVIQC